MATASARSRDEIFGELKRELCAMFELEQFKAVRTVEGVVDAVEQMLRA